MTEKEMYILARTIQEGMEDVVKDKSAPGPQATLKRIRKFSEQYYIEKNKG